MPPTFICIPTPTLGGAEKRFVGLWRHLCLSGCDVRLVIQERLHDVLEHTAEFQPLPERIEVFGLGEGSVRSAMRRTLSRLHGWFPGAVFHYVMISPLEVQRFVSRRTLFSEPIASLSLFNWKGRLLSRLSALAAGHTDALEANVVAEYQRLFPFRRAAITHTPNSFVDLDFFRPSDTKRDRLTFIGLFSETKQAFRLARATPAIDRALKAIGVRAEFRFLGRETQSPGVSELLAAYPDVDARAQFVTDPAPTLAESKVVFSLQTITNYPSKALLEGMACGALPVVTDVGGTRQIVTPDFGAFVSRDFSDQEIADACVSVFRLSEEQRRARVAAMRSFIAQRFSISTMAAYYQRIYSALAEQA